MSEIPTAIEMAMLQDAGYIAKLNQSIAEHFLSGGQVNGVNQSCDAPAYIAEAVAGIWRAKGYEATVDGKTIVVSIPTEIREAVKEHIQSEG